MHTSPRTLLRHSLPLAVSAAVLALANGAYAQQPAEAEQLSEEVLAKAEIVYVTARKTEEDSQDVPLSLRVLGANDLRKQGFNSIGDTAALVPGVTYDVGTYIHDTRPAMRGMQNERGRPSVAILIDYIDASTENLSIPGGSSALLTSLLDVERVEVVKGPQTTLYGRNAFAGAINVVTRRPTFEWESRLGTEVGNYGRRTFDAGISGPLTDTLAFRASVVKDDFDGFYNNPVTGEELGNEDTLAGSLGLLWTPSDRLNVYGRYQYSDQAFSQMAVAMIPWSERLPVPGGTFAAGPPGSPQMPCPADLSSVPPQVAFACTRGVVTGGLGASESDIALSPNPNTGQPFEGMAQEQHFATLQVDYEVANGTLTYLAGYMNNTSTDSSDSDYTDFEVNDPMLFSLSADNYFKYDFEHVVQELRHVGSKGRWQWSAGVASYFETAQLDNGATFWLRNPNSFLSGPPFNIPTEPNPGVNPINPQERETEHYSAFFSLAYELSDQWTVAVEGRYSRDDIEYTVPTWTRQQVSLLGLTPLDICPVTADDRDVPQSQKYPNVPYNCFVSDDVQTSVFTPRVLVEYQPTPDALYYASITRGFKPGGFAALEAVELSTQRYEEETVTAYEVGAKTRMLDNRLQLNGALFYNAYQDQQIGIQQTPPGSFTPIGGITNAGRVDVYGAEVDALYNVTDNLRLQLAYAYTHAEFDEFIQTDPGSSALNKTEAGNIDADFSGNMVGKSPEHAFNMDMDYRDRIEGTRYSWFAGGTALYRSKRYFDESNLAYMPDYWRLNLRAGIENSRYQVIAFVDNALDDDTILTGQRAVSLGHPDGFAPGRGYLVHLPAPRTYGLRLQANF